ncbi:MAG TPA: EF-P lysine aminoacylase EpmA [Polyangiaceae bacterium]|jgi:lysyl-tRNA synthetase class 2
MKRLRERARILGGLRRFFDARGFVEVQTPAVVPSPGLDLHLDAFAIAARGDDDARWLATSPEYQMKRLLADGWERIYQIGPAFRRGEIGARHNPEFTLLEYYRANAGVEEVMRDAEQLVSAVTGGRVSLHGRTIVVDPPLERLAVCDAFERFAGWPAGETLRAAAEDEDAFHRALVDKVEPALERFDRGVFLVDYPATQASLARKSPRDPRLAERFELYVAGVELCNGFGELVDPVEQRTRLEHDRLARSARSMPAYPIDEKFLQALARMPPSGGNALGVDRLVALACGTTDIREVVAFVDDEL